MSFNLDNKGQPQEGGQQEAGQQEQKKVEQVMDEIEHDIKDIADQLQEARKKGFLRTILEKFKGLINKNPKFKYTIISLAMLVPGLNVNAMTEGGPKEGNPVKARVESVSTASEEGQITEEKGKLENLDLRVGFEQDKDTVKLAVDVVKKYVVSLKDLNIDKKTVKEELKREGEAGDFEAEVGAYLAEAKDVVKEDSKEFTLINNISSLAYEDALTAEGKEKVEFKGGYGEYTIHIHDNNHISKEHAQKIAQNFANEMIKNVREAFKGDKDVLKELKKKLTRYGGNIKGASMIFHIENGKGEQQTVIISNLDHYFDPATYHIGMG